MFHVEHQDTYYIKTRIILCFDRLIAVAERWPWSISRQMGRHGCWRLELLRRNPQSARPYNNAARGLSHDRQAGTCWSWQNGEGNWPGEFTVRKSPYSGSRAGRSFSDGIDGVRRLQRSLFATPNCAAVVAFRRDHQRHHSSRGGRRAPAGRGRSDAEEVVAVRRQAIQRADPHDRRLLLVIHQECHEYGTSPFAGPPPSFQRVLQVARRIRNP